MAYNTKNIARDAGNIPVPQYYNPIADEYEVIQGANGASRVFLYDPNGNPLLTSANPGVVKISDGTDQLAINSDGSINAQLTGSNALKGAVQNVATAGTRVQLPNYTCREVTIIAKRSNTGSIYVGGIDVSSTVYGVELKANDSVTLAVNNTNLIYIDASVSGEGISYVAI